MIGQHEGKELELILDGQKHLAIFHDIVPDHGQIAEKIIPDQAYAPYVVSGKFIRKQKDFTVKKSGDTIRVVCFSTPDQTWRIDTVFWIKKQTYSGYLFPHNADDIMLGKLLGYTEKDIEDFIKKRNRIAA